MNEIMLEGAGYFDEPPDYQHDWRIISVGENSETHNWLALCLECGISTTPDVMNSVVEILEAENDALGRTLNEHVETLAARDKRIEELQAELAARDVKCCATCRMLDNDTWFANEGDKLATPYCAAHSCTCAPNGFDEWIAREGK